MGLKELFTIKKRVVEPEEEVPCAFMASFFDNPKLFGIGYESLLSKAMMADIFFSGDAELTKSLPIPNMNLIADNEFYLPIFYSDNVRDDKTGELKTGPQVMLDYCLGIIFPGYREKNEAEGRYLIVKNKYDEDGKVMNQYVPGVRNARFCIRKKAKDGVNRTLEKVAGLELLMLLAFSPGLVDYFTKYFGRLVIDDMDYVLKDGDTEISVKFCVAKYGINDPPFVELIPIKPKSEDSENDDEEIGNICDIVVDLPLDIISFN